MRKKKDEGEVVTVQQEDTGNWDVSSRSSALGLEEKQQNTSPRLSIDKTNTLRLSLADVRRKRIVVLGQTGTGKSNAVAAVVEELLPYIPMTIVDPESEYWSLKSLFSVLVVGRSPHADLEVSPENMGQLAEWSVTHGVAVIIDLDDYTKDESFALLVPYFQRLWKVCSRVRRPYMVVVDEAQDYIPQNSQTPLKDLLITIAKKGRKRDIWSLFASQRAQSMDKNYLTQTELRILHQVSYNTDLDLYKLLIPREISATEIENTVPKLEPGEAYAIFKHKPYRIQMRRRTSFDPSEERDDLTVEPPLLRQLDAAMLEELRTTLASPLDVDRREKEELLRHIHDLEKKLQQISRTPSRRVSTKSTTELNHNEKAMDLLRAQLQKQAMVHEGEIATRDELITQLRIQIQQGKEQSSLAGLQPPIPSPNTLEIGQATIGLVQLPPGGTGKPGKGSTVGIKQEGERLRRALAEATVVIERQEKELQQLRSELHIHESKQKGTVSPEKGQLTKGQERKLSTCVRRLQQFPKFQRVLLHLLLEREGEALTYEEISELLHYQRETVANSSTTALQKEGLIKRPESTLGYVSRFSAYCKEKYPGVDAQIVLRRIVEQVSTD